MVTGDRIPQHADHSNWPIHPTRPNLLEIPADRQSRHPANRRERARCRHFPGWGDIAPSPGGSARRFTLIAGRTGLRVHRLPSYAPELIASRTFVPASNAAWPTSPPETGHLFRIDPASSRW